MAFDTSNLRLIEGTPGFSVYRYDTTDSLSTVAGNGYMNNTDDNVNLAVGDIIKVVVWATAVQTGTISDVGEHIVMQNTSGALDLSDDYLGATPATGT